MIFIQDIYICGIHSFVSRRLRLPQKSEEFAHPSVPKGAITASRHLKYSFLLTLRQKMLLLRTALHSKLCDGDLLWIEPILTCLSERQRKRTSAVQQLNNVKQFKHETGLMDTQAYPFHFFSRYYFFHFKNAGSYILRL